MGNENRSSEFPIPNSPFPIPITAFGLLLSVVLLFAVTVTAAPADDVLVFSFFRNNGEDGLYLATSEDGLNWKALNGDRPLLKPEVGESRLMRDPSITRGPDGTFHMVWTT